jgi:hypothetical protein
VNSTAPQGEKVALALGRARVSGKTSLSRLVIAEAVKALGIKVRVRVVRRRIREDSLPYGRDRYGRVHVLVGAYSNLPPADHSRRRKPQDEAIIRDLEAQAASLRQVFGTPEVTQAPPRTSRAPEGPN